MKKWLCMVLCIGMMFGVLGCGEEKAPAERQTDQQKEIENEAADTFDFTIDEFVQATDERLTERGKKLLSEYELVEDGANLMYKINDTSSLMVEINEESRKVEGFIFYETFDYLSGEELDNYTALLINSLIVIDPYDIQEIYEDLNLESTEEGTTFAEGTNAKYIYEVKDGVGKVSAIPATAFE